MLPNFAECIQLTKYYLVIVIQFLCQAHILQRLLTCKGQIDVDIYG